jgi:site-specific recombinase XerD
LRSLKSENTRKAYESHWRGFAAHFGAKPGPFVQQLMGMHKADVLDMAHEYSDAMEEAGKAVSTRAAHLRAITSMIDRWYRAEVFPWTLKGLVNVPSPDRYTDVEGVPAKDVQEMLDTLGALGTVEGLRDRAILLLLHDGGLRCRELYTLHTAHWSSERREVRIWPKGRARGIRVAQSVSPRAQRAVDAWREAAGYDDGPLFCKLPIEDAPEPLTAWDVFSLTKSAAKLCGVTAPVSPHRFRHAGITYLARQGVSPDELRAFARHASFDTTLIYIRQADDAVKNLTERFGGDEDQ